MVTKRLIVFSTAILLGGCALDKQRAPALAGPSELGVSLEITATPDIITQDGKSSAVVQIMARDASSQPVRGLTLRAETAVNGQIADFGELSSRTVSTGNDGRTTITYLSPPAPSVTASSDNIVEIVVTPVGTNYGNSISRTVVIRLARPNNPPPNQKPVPRFFVTPTSPNENEDVLFDGSASTDDGRILSYSWNFGDGGTGQGVRTFHAYALAGSYRATLTVTDDAGASVTTPIDEVVAVTVGQATNPVASFTSSPSTPKVGQTVNFTAAKSTAATGREIVSYAWDFGDGSIGAGMSPTHVYGLAATYTVTLTVTDNTGRKNTTSSTVTIAP